MLITNENFDRFIENIKVELPVLVDVWTVGDIMSEALELGYFITEKKAVEIMEIAKTLREKYYSGFGTYSSTEYNWDLIRDAVKQCIKKED
jgi:hypothetical protein